MSIKVALNHRTQYRYDKAVSLGPHLIQLRPAPHCRTPILSYSLNVAPAKHFLNWQLDPYNNHVARVLFPEKTTEFLVDVDLVAELCPFNPFDFFLEPGVTDYPFKYEPGLARDLDPYLLLDPLGPLLRTFLANVSSEKHGTISFLVELNRRVRDEINYVTRLDPGVQTCEQTLEKRYRIVPRFFMAACTDSPQFGYRGALRLRILDSDCRRNSDGRRKHRR